MPTAAKLVGAIAFALLGYLIAGRAVTTLPDNAEVGWFREIIAVFGWFVGWSIVGPSAEKRLAITLAAGLTASAALAVLGVGFVAIYQMLVKSAHNFYASPMQALESMFELAWKRAAVLGDANILALLILGGLVAGALARGAAKLWR